MYLNEQQAKESIQALFSIYNSAFTLKIIKREPKNLALKYVYFEVLMPSLNAEVIFNDLFKAVAFNNELALIKNDSSDNQEKFLLQAEIQVIGLGNEN